MALGSIFSLLSESGVLNNTQQTQSTGGEVVNLLGSLLGGGQTTQTNAQAPAAGGQNATEEVLGLIMNVVQSPTASNYIQPIVNKVAAKLNLPPETAMTVVTFVVHYLAANHGTKITNGEDISSILQAHSNTSYIQNNNIANQLANKTGLDNQTAATAMAEVFKLLGVSQ
jgi:hypothetical protein